MKKAGELNPAAQDLITSMKSVVLDGKYRIILSGSLLGVNVNDVLLNPTGYMDVIQMFPLDFEEYLWAKKVGLDSINYLKKCFINKEKVDTEMNKLFLDYFKEYVLIGGMPEAVDSFIHHNNLYLVQTIQEQIISAYSFDITAYINDEAKKLRVREIYQAIPSELNSKNKRFISSHVIDSAYLKSKNLLDEFLWLTNAAIVIPVYNITEAIIPLVLSCERKTLKFFMNDIGILDTLLLSTNIRKKILCDEKIVNYGAPYENVCAQELYAHGFKNNLFYYNSKKHGEVDFLVEYEGEVLPIEIKLGKTLEQKTYNHTALNNLISIYPISIAYVFGECNVVKENEKIYQLPIYMISFLQKQG